MAASLLLALAVAAQSSLAAPPCTVWHPPAFAREAAEVARAVSIELPRLERLLQAPPLTRCDIEIVGGEGTGQDAALIPPWAAGVAHPAEGAIFIRAGRLGLYPLRRLRSVTAHELAHLVMWRAAGDGAPRMPGWFREGAAGSLAREGEFADFVHLWASPLPSAASPLATLDRYFEQTDSPARVRAAYAGSYLFMTQADRRHGDALAARTLAGLRRGLPFEEAWRAAAGGTPLARDEAAWRDWLAGGTRWAILATSTGALWMAVTALLLAAWAIKRRKARRTLEEWPEDDDVIMRPQ